MQDYNTVNTSFTECEHPHCPYCGEPIDVEDFHSWSIVTDLNGPGLGAVCGTVHHYYHHSHTEGLCEGYKRHAQIERRGSEKVYDAEGNEHYPHRFAKRVAWAKLDAEVIYNPHKYWSYVDSYDIDHPWPEVDAIKNKPGHPNQIIIDYLELFRRTAGIPHQAEPWQVVFAYNECLELAAFAELDDARERLDQVREVLKKQYADFRERYEAERLTPENRFIELLEGQSWEEYTRRYDTYHNWKEYGLKAYVKSLEVNHAAG